MREKDYYGAIKGFCLKWNLPEVWNSDRITGANLIYEVIKVINAMIVELREYEDQVDGKLDEMKKMIEDFLRMFDEDLSDTVRDQLTVWLNDGTLGDIINETLFNSKVDKSEFEEVATQLEHTTLNGRTLKFETVGDMVNNSSRIKNGDFVEVMGYYTVGDGGGHTRAISNVSNPLSVDVGNGLYANVTGSQDDLRHFGIVFGTDNDGIFNGEMLKKVLSYYNGFNQKGSLKNEPINVSNFYHTINRNNFNYQNISLRVLNVTSEKNYILGIESAIIYITMRDFSITQTDLLQNRDNILKQYAIKLADNVNHWGGARYNIERATITGFSVPLFVHTWNGSIKDVNFYYTDTGVVAFGTSTEISSVYVNNSLYGNVLGAIYNIQTDSFSTSTHSVFYYSTLGSLANDTVERNILVCGKTSGILITSIGCEKPGDNANSVVLAVDNGKWRLAIGNAYFSSTGNDIPEYLLSSQDPLAEFHLVIENMTNTSISKMTNNTGLYVEIINHLSYRRLNYNGVFNNKLIMNNENTALNGRYKNLDFTGIAKSYAGGSNVQLTGNFYEIETFITKNQILKIPITPLLWASTPVQRRSFKIRVELSVSDVDSNGSRSINNQYFITVHSVVYTKGETLITPTIKRLDDSGTDNLIVEVDNTGDYPYLLIKTPNVTGSAPATYYLSAKVVSGMQQANVIIEDY